MHLIKNYAFTFARGGSKGLPEKHIKKLAGTPLINYSIDAALRCSVIDKVFVSTDCNDIASIASEAGAEIIMRPFELATDTSPEWLAWRHAIGEVQKIHGEFDNFVSLPATSPLRSTSDIEQAIEKRLSSGSDLCLSIVKASRSPFFNMVKLESDGSVKLLMTQEKEVLRRQDSPEIYDITTVVYVSSPEYILNNFGLFSGRTTAVEIPKQRAVDIDDIYDFKLAEVILNERLGD